MGSIILNELNRYDLQTQDSGQPQFSRAHQPIMPEKGFKSAKIALAGGKIRKM